MTADTAALNPLPGRSPRRGRRPWMAKRPAGIEAFITTFRTYHLDRGLPERFHRPVYYALGGRSNPDKFAEIATRLRTVFPDFELEVFDGRHHFDPPHRIEPARLAASLATPLGQGWTCIVEAVSSTKQWGCLAVGPAA